MSQDKRSALPEDPEVAGGASREQTRKLQQALNLVASFGDGGDTSSLEAIAHLVPAALQRTVEKLEKERQWEFLWFILEVEWIRQRIEELDRMIEDWQRENEDLKKSIGQSRNREQELRRAEEQRDFERDPQTGRFKNKAVEQAVSDYEKRFGQVDRDNPGMLVLVLQWTRQQEIHAQADWWEQIGHNNRKIEKALEEKKDLEASLPQGEYRQATSAKAASRDLDTKEANAFVETVEEPGSLNFDASANLDFLAGPSSDESGDSLRSSANNERPSALNSKGIQCSIDLGTEFSRAVEGLEPEPVLVAEAAPRTLPAFKPG